MAHEGVMAGLDPVTHENTAHLDKYLIKNSIILRQGHRRRTSWMAGTSHGHDVALFTGDQWITPLEPKQSIAENQKTS